MKKNTDKKSNKKKSNALSKYEKKDKENIVEPSIRERHTFQQKECVTQPIQNFIQKLNPSKMQQAIILSEIINEPVCRRRRDRIKRMGR